MDLFKEIMLWALIIVLLQRSDHGLLERTQLTPFLIEWNVNRVVNRVLVLMTITVVSIEHLADSVSVHVSLKLNIGQFCVYCYDC